jgi:sec-independent protein translocase protein TatB
MLGLDFSELLIIGVVALVVVGPKELPQLMRTVGQWVGKARRMATEFQGQMNEAIREAELDDVKKHVDDLRSLSPKALLAEQFSSVTRTLDEVKRDTEAEMAGIEAGVSAPTVADGGTVEAPTDETPAMAEGEIAARIDAASPMPMDLTEPVFDLTPAPGSPVEVAEAAPAASEPAEAKKERDA